MAGRLEVFVPDALWLADYPVSLGGARFHARMTVIKLRSGALVIHSPSRFDDALGAEVSALGPVAAIVAPGNFHWLHVASWQKAFPDAKTYICPGVKERAREIAFDEVLGDGAPALWAGELSQVCLRGTRVMREVAFFHHASRTLILVDLLENFTAATLGTNWLLRLLFRAVGMWGRPRPAPEYRFAWGDKALVREDMQRILGWDFSRVILSHGDLVTDDAPRVVREAWAGVLGTGAAAPRA